MNVLEYQFDFDLGNKAKQVFGAVSIKTFHWSQHIGEF